MSTRPYMKERMALDLAWRRTREMHQASPVEEDMVAAATQINKWPIVSAMFSGIEQTLKLMAVQNRGWDLQKEAAPGGKLRRKGHHLAHWYRQIDAAKASLIANCWKEYVTFYSPYRGRGGETGRLIANKTEKLESFLEYLTDECSYEKWRYMLLESGLKTVLDTCPDLMLDLWYILLAVEEAKGDSVLWKAGLLFQSVEEPLPVNLESPNTRIAKRVMEDANRRKITVGEYKVRIHAGPLRSISQPGSRKISGNGGEAPALV